MKQKMIISFSKLICQLNFKKKIYVYTHFQTNFQIQKKNCKLSRYTYRPIRNERENVYSKSLLMKSLKKWFNFLSWAI